MQKENKTEQKIDSNKSLKRFYGEAFTAYRSSGGKIIDSVSPYFGLFGSTQIEDIPYSVQLDIKEQALHKIFTAIVNKSIHNTFEIQPSPEIYGYRFRMDYVCSLDPIKEPHNRFGQRKHKRYNIVVDMHQGVLMKDEWFQKTRAIYEFIHSNGIENYDLVKRTGDLRYLVVRQHNDNAMLTIVTKETGGRETIIDAMKLALKKSFKSIYWIVNSSDRDDVLGDIEHQEGEHFLSVSIKASTTFTFKIGPNSFFQNNIPAFESILVYIEDFFKNNNFKDYALIDMYCGVGLLGLIFSSHCNSLIGFDNNTENIEYAIINATDNEITNAEFLTLDLSQLIDSEVLYQKSKSIVIVDPPRTGLERSSIDNILKVSPEYLIYISCNPITQARDIASLKEKYVTIHMKGFDLFPHTYHVENVAILKKLGNA